MINPTVSMGKVLLNPSSFISSLLFHFLHAHGLNANPNFENVVGTILQACSWAHANSIVVEHITLLSTMSDYRQQNLELKIRDRLSVDDAIALCTILEWTWLLLLSLQWTLGVSLMMTLLRQLMFKVRYRVSWLRRHFRGNHWINSQIRVSQLFFSPHFFWRKAVDLLLSSKQRSKEVPHLKDRLSPLLQPLCGGQSLNLSIFQSLKVYTFKTFAFPPPSPLLTTPSLFSHCS